MKWSPWITVLAGVCLLAAAFATAYNTLSNVASAEAVVLGVLIAGLGFWTALSTDVPAYVDYLLMVCGAWSVIVPFALAYGNTTMAHSDVIVGIVVAAVAVYRLRGGAWRPPESDGLGHERPERNRGRQHLMPPAVQLQP